MVDTNPNQRFLMLTDFVPAGSLPFEISPTAIAVGVFHPYADIPFGQRYEIAYSRPDPDQYAYVSFTLAAASGMYRKLSFLKAGKAALCVFETDGNVPNIVSSMPTRRMGMFIESSVALCTFDDWPLIRQQKCDNPLVLGDYGAVSDADIVKLVEFLPPMDPWRIWIEIKNATNAIVNSFDGGNSTKIHATKNKGRWEVTKTTHGIV